MDGGVGVASGLLALIVFAFDTSKSLYEAVSSYRSQQKTVKDVLADLEALLTVLGVVRDYVQHRSQERRLDCLETPVKSCLSVCQEMGDMLSKCTTHSQDGKNSMRDWLKMQYRGKTLDEMKKRLDSYKSTLSVAFDAVKIQDEPVTQQGLDKLKDLIDGTSADLEDQLSDVREKLDHADENLRAVLQEEQTCLLGNLASIVQSQQTLDGARGHVKVERNRGGDRSRTVFGTSVQNPGFDLSVTDNDAGVDSTMAAGVLSEAVMLKALDNAQTPNIALVRQLLQTQTTARPNNLNSVIQRLAMQGGGVPIDPPAGIRALQSSQERAIRRYGGHLDELDETGAIAQGEKDDELEVLRR